MSMNTLNRMKYCVFMLIILLFTISPGYSLQKSKLTEKTRKETVNKICELVNENYILPDKGKSMTDQISKNLVEGDYKTISDPAIFAKQLTTDMQHVSNDKHLVVVYNPKRIAEMKIEEDDPSSGEQEKNQRKRIERRRRNNFGFKKVEVLDGNIGYLDFRFFRDTDYAAQTAIGAMKFIENSDAVIIDLRNNFGGSASMYMLLISYFLDSNPVHLSTVKNMITKTEDQRWSLSHVPGKRMPDQDLYILTSKRTFSAAEQFAYSLKHIRGAKVIGKYSGGGAHMATRMIINDNLYIFMPFAGGFSPVTGTNWEGIGVKPDLKISEEKAFEAAYLMALEKLKKETAEEDWKEKLNKLISKLKDQKI